MSYTTHDILESATKSLFPFMAMVAYKNKNNEVYIESHPINKKGQMLAGAPLSEACITELAGSFSQEQVITPHGKLPSRLLYFDNRIGHRKYIWYNPPKKQQLFFAKQLNIPHGQYHIPGIIYLVSGDDLHLYAFKGSKPNKPDDKLYKAPFFNTSDGRVCLGNVKLNYPENPSFEEFINYWEKKFWQTEFTHLGGSHNPTKSNLSLVTKQSKEAFDYDQLIEMDKTLSDLFK